MGDQVIKLAAQAAQQSLRKDDSVFRIGGEEFVCVLPNAAMTQAYDAAERIRLTFQRLATDVDGVPIGATVSLGVAASDGISQRPNEIFARADNALYEAKEMVAVLIRRSWLDDRRVLGEDFTDLTADGFVDLEAGLDEESRSAGPFS